MRTCRLAAALAILALVTFTGCLQPSEDRALRDLEVGIASGSGAQVSVRGGLAAVRKIQNGKLVLWGGAPSFELSLRLDASASRTWEFELHNGVPGVDLQVQAGDEQVTPVTPSVLAPTRTKWTFEVEVPVHLTLRLSVPGQEDPGPFSFAVLSDVQSAVDRVQEVFSRVNEEPGLAFVWTTGDLTEQGTAEQMDRFQRELEALAIPMYGTLGNHDVFDSPTPWHGRFGRCNVHFRHRQVSFTAVDSASGTLDPLVYEWLDGWLDQGRGGTHVFATHIPILDPIGVRGGGFASRNEAAKLLSLLARGRVDATFYGHIHSYYVFENAGIPAYISGGGGALPERFDGIGRHFLVVDADAAAGVTSVRRVDVD